MPPSRAALAAWLLACAAMVPAATAQDAACTACAGAPLTLPPPITVPFDSGYGAGSDDLPLTDPRLARPAGTPAAAPDQQLLLLDTQPGVVVAWATGNGSVAEGAVTRPKAPESVVEWGTAANKLDKKARATDAPRTYVQTYPNATYTSPYFHRVPLRDLQAGKTYYFRAGSPSGGWTPVRSFRAPAPAGAAYPYRVVLVGDLGATINSSSTLDHVVASDGDIGVQLGDFVYADNYYPNNTPRAVAKLPKPANGTYQPRWDAWGRLISRVYGELPFYVVPGNHEVETDAAGKQWQAYKARLAPSQSGPSWYGATSGPIHFIVLDAYSGWARGTEQWDWLKQELGRVNRTKTPWLVVAVHPPWYSSYTKHYRTVECMRDAMEPLLVDASADIVFAGHIHAYERHHRSVAGKPCADGPYYITIGDGGNSEKLYTTFVDPWGATTEKSQVVCPDVKVSGDACSRAAPGPFCPDGVPPSSAFREPSFGHGVLEVLSPTRARWTWHRNRDGDKEAADSVLLTRGDELCETVGDGRV